MKTVFFSDFKANNLHWKPEEILAEEKDGISLTEAISQKEVVKMDIIVPLNGRYVEASAFYILKSKSGYINVDSNYFGNFASSLLADIKELKDVKPFKAVKRAFSLARVQKNFAELEKLVFLVRSSLAKIAVINADLETIELLIDKDSDFDINYTINEVHGFKERLSSLIDVNSLDTEKTSLMVELIITHLRSYNKSESSKDNLKTAINRMHDYLLNVLNKETKDYLESINYTFPNTLQNIEHRKCDTETLKDIASLTD